MIFYDYYADIPREMIEEFISRQKLGRLATSDSQGQPHIGLYPFLYRGSTIEMHLHREDEQLKDLKTNARCVFELDEILGTIPSNWLHHANAAFATAYYHSVIFECEAIVSDDLQVIAAQQQRLMEQHQPEGGYQAVSAEHAMYTGSLNSIAAISLQICKRKIKWKLAQNRDHLTRVKIVSRLKERGLPSDLAAAEAIQWTIDYENSK